MKTEEEITDEIKSLKKSRDSFVVETTEWRMFSFAIIKLEWVIE